jgi:hypothetical protein
MPTPNDSNPNQNLHAPQLRHLEATPTPQAAKRRTRPPWGFAFLFFLAGFVLLVVLSKLSIARVTADVLKAVAAGLCVAAFVIARRAQRSVR